MVPTPAADEHAYLLRVRREEERQRPTRPLQQPGGRERGTISTGAAYMQVVILDGYLMTSSNGVSTTS